MIMKYRVVIISVIVLLSGGAHGEVLDRVVAVVDKEIILFSELEAQLQLHSIQTRTNLSDEAVRDSLRKELLDRMIEDKVLLVQAERDTSINVTNKEVDEALTAQIERIKSQFPSEDAFLEQLRAEGLTLKGLQDQYRDEVKNQILKDMLIQRRLAGVRVSSGEVKRFYEANKDSLPEKPAGVRLAHILFGTQPGQATRDSLLQYADLIRQKAIEGEDFALLAKTYSDDANSRDSGGELGWYAANDLLPGFIEALTDLEIGQVARPIASEFGYHLIKLEEKRPSSPIDLGEDYDTLEEMAKRDKTRRQIEEWLNRISAELYIDKRL